eukprot:Clim_evm25s119 gene=Clim_evmTU25s119
MSLATTESRRVEPPSNLYLRSPVRRFLNDVEDRVNDSNVQSHWISSPVRNQHGVLQTSDAEDFERLVEDKERELRQVLNLRTKALEEELRRTTTELVLAQDNFSRLREDFDYNLELLEERDKELKEFEKYSAEVKDLLLERDNMIGILEKKVEDFAIAKEELNRMIEELNFESAETTKKHNKDIQSLEWRHAEELKEVQDILNKERTEAARRVSEISADFERESTEAKLSYEKAVQQNKDDCERRIREAKENTERELDKVASLLGDVARARKECAEAQQQIDLAREDSLAWQRKLKTMEWEKINAVDQKEDEIHILESKISDLESIMVKKSHEVHDAERKAANAEVAKERAQTAIEENEKRLNQTIKGMKEKIDDQRKELDERSVDQRKENEALRTQMHDLKRKLVDVEEQRQRIKREAVLAIGQKDEEISVLQQKVDSTRNENSQIRNTIVDLKADISKGIDRENEIRRQLLQAQLNLDERNWSIKEDDPLVQQMMGERDKFRALADEQQRKVSDLEAQMRKNDFRLRNTEHKVTGHSVKSKSPVDDDSELGPPVSTPPTPNQLGESDEFFAGFKSRPRTGTPDHRLASENAQLKSAVKELRLQLEEVSYSRPPGNDDLLAENTHLKTVVQNLRRELEQLVIEREETVRLQHGTVDFHEMSQRLNESMATEQRHRTRQIEAEVRISELEMMLQNARGELAEKQIDSQNMSITLQKQIAHLQHEVDRKNEEISLLQSEHVNRSRVLSSRAEARAHDNTVVDHLNRTMKDLKSELAMLREHERPESPTSRDRAALRKAERQIRSLMLEREKLVEANNSLRSSMIHAKEPVASSASHHGRGSDRIYGRSATQVKNTSEHTLGTSNGTVAISRVAESTIDVYDDDFEINSGSEINSSRLPGRQSERIADSQRRSMNAMCSNAQRRTKPPNFNRLRHEAVKEDNGP